MSGRNLLPEATENICAISKDPGSPSVHKFHLFNPSAREAAASHKADALSNPNSL